MENKKIGSAIQYFRESYNISQSTLGIGLCSVATLSRIEAGERDVDSLLLETLLERLGKTPNQFELILSDVDYLLYQNRENIKKNINEKKYNEAYALLSEYEKAAASKGSVHLQFIVTCKAYLNELKGGNIEETIDLLTEAITYTIPDFKANKITNYYLSNSELNIIIDMVQHMQSAGMYQEAEAILLQIIDYLDSYNSMEVSNSLYPRVAIIACQLLLQENKYDKALDMSNKGLEKSKGGRRMDYVGELYHLKAKATEALRKKHQCKTGCNESIKMYLQAYYIFNLCEAFDEANKVKKHLQEEYQWEDID